MQTKTEATILIMRTALELAGRGLGAVWPNPAVGCILIDHNSKNRVIGRGWTQPGGRPHAETEALRQAGDRARGATAYVTLEPCNHHGETPPCSEALIEAGISRAFIATNDPDARVSGSGIARLIEAGIEVTTDVCKEEALELNAGFFQRIHSGRPLFTLKIATTLDGRIATHSGESQWITGKEARAHTHRLRADHDAVLTGIGTVLADEPELTCRLPGLGNRSPLRIVLDSHMRLPVTSHLVQKARKIPTWVVTGKISDPEKLEALSAMGVIIIEAETTTDGRPDLSWLAGELGRRGLTRVLVESGGTVATEMMRAGLVDRVAWFHAPRLIGGDGIPAMGTLGISTLADAQEYARRSLSTLGKDILETYHRLPNTKDP